MALIDPTYLPHEIQANPAWALAFEMSEVDNDQAPIGWAQYIALARWLLRTYRLTRIDHSPTDTERRR